MKEYTLFVMRDNSKRVVRLHSKTLSKAVLLGRTLLHTESNVTKVRIKHPNKKLTESILLRQ